MKDEFLRETGSGKFLVTVTHDDIAGSWYKDGKAITVRVQWFKHLLHCRELF